MYLAPFTINEAFREFSRVRAANPLVQCITNDVVQEITANVLLAAGASPAMVVSEVEAPVFAGIASALLINVGTLGAAQKRTIPLAVRAANESGKPWVLDPVAFGVGLDRDKFIRETLLPLSPAVIRGNASEILALAGAGSGGKGVDSTASSDDAMESAALLAQRQKAIVCVTGQTDYITDGTQTFAVSGGTPRTTLVVGTGCSLSALTAAFVAGAKNRLSGVAAACLLSKKAAEYAAPRSEGPGTFKDVYIDGLYLVSGGKS